MFSYLRTKEEFLHDCEKIRYKIGKEMSEEGVRYLPCKLSPTECGSYCMMRGCTSLFDCDRCSDGCYKYTDRKAKYSRCAEPYADCEGCTNISEMVGWLVKNVQNANWGNAVALGEIHAWCQSVGVYMHDIVKALNNSSIAVGMEYYLENRMVGNKRPSASRADILLAGFNQRGQKIIVIIELKQNDDNYFSAGVIGRATDEIRAYISSLQVASHKSPVACLFRQGSCHW